MGTGRAPGERFDAVVIGGGAAGLMAAVFAASRVGSVCVVDRGEQLAKKLRITGKGRCNLTNQCDRETFLRHIRRGSKFLYSSISGFSTDDVMGFFRDEGISLVTERGLRVFPESGGADGVAETLIAAAKRAGVVFRRGRVVSVETDSDAVAGVTLESGGRIACRAAVIATGGLSYPKTGSTGDGYRLAEALGHTVETPLPSLVPIVCGGDIPSMQGLSLRNVGLTAEAGGRLLFKEQGEMLFTHFGMSGPLVLSLSSHAVGMNLPDIDCRIDLKPGLDAEQLDRRILRDFYGEQNRDYKNSLDRLLPRKIIPAVVARSGVDPGKKVREITAGERARIVGAVKRFGVPMLSFRPVAEAIVTAGGVSLKEIHPGTMESKRVKNLHFAGEVIAADGYTGGFNLTIAFSTAVAAARHLLLGEEE